VEKGIQRKENNRLFYDVLEDRQSPRRRCTEEKTEEGGIEEWRTNTYVKYTDLRSQFIYKFPALNFILTI
jgi:hypothetical protein